MVKSLAAAAAALLSAASLLNTQALAADAAVEEVVSISHFGSWRLDIRDDGSANLRYGSDSGNGYRAPAGTFDAEQVRKALVALESAPKAENRHRTHYIYWFEAERKLAPEKEPPSRYSQDEATIVPLFEKAAAASGVKDTVRGKELMKTTSFELPPEAKLKRLYGLRTPGGWMLSIHNDGSAQLVFGDGGSINTSMVPAGTFKPDDVRKKLDGLKLDAGGGHSTHFVVWYEEQRKAPDDGPPPRYTQDESSIVPLFEKAANARRGKSADSMLESLGRQRPTFGLKQ